MAERPGVLRVGDRVLFCPASTRLAAAVGVILVRSWPCRSVTIWLRLVCCCAGRLPGVAVVLPVLVCEA